MLYSTGSIKASLNDDIIADSKWELHPINDNELEINLDVDGKRYQIRDFNLDDLGNILNTPHTTNEIKYEELFDKDITKLIPYPQFSYKKTITNNKKNNNIKSKKKQKPRRSLKKRTKKDCYTPKKDCYTPKKKCNKPKKKCN